eukprot:9474201-Pyramimonas_sp.AAC.1
MLDLVKIRILASGEHARRCAGYLKQYNYCLTNSGVAKGAASVSLVRPTTPPNKPCPRGVVATR